MERISSKYQASQMTREVNIKIGLRISQLILLPATACFLDFIKADPTRQTLSYWQLENRDRFCANMFTDIFEIKICFINKKEEEENTEEEKEESA